MNDAAHLTDHRGRQHDEVGLMDLSLGRASAPCSPLDKSHVNSDRALQALLGQQPIAL